MFATSLAVKPVKREIDSKLAKRRSVPPSDPVSKGPASVILRSLLGRQTDAITAVAGLSGSSTTRARLTSSCKCSESPRKKLSLGGAVRV
jgi:hypothetical protein